MAFGKREKTLLIILGFALLFVIYQYTYVPLEEKTDTLRASLIKKQSEFQQAKIKSLLIPQMEERIALLKEELIELERELPAYEELPQLIKILTSSARKYNLDITEFTFQSKIESEFYTEYNYNINLDTNYHQLALFFEEISRSPRILNIKNLNLYSGKTSSNEPTNVKASFTVAAYTVKKTGQ